MNALLTLGGLPRLLDRRLLAPVPWYRLVEVHTLVALVVGLRLATRDWTLVAQRPAVLTDGPMGWLPVEAPVAALLVVQVAGILGVALVLAGVRSRVGFAVAWTAYVVLTALWGSSGKVMHDDVLTVTVGFVLLFAAPPARGTARGEDAARTGWTVRAALAVVACVYLLTGVQKLVHTGPSWALGENMSWILRQGSSPFGDGLTRLVADQPVLTRALATGALLLELTAPLWLAVRVTRIPFAVAVAAMHTSIWAFLGLDYSAWALTAAAVAVPTGLAVGRRLLPGRRREVRPRPIARVPA
ncbi:hypothetical protein IF650_08550 [Cellulosimicrobium terreum]|nr:hypothetical protein [Cellulosimicrobium terreum]